MAVSLSWSLQSLQSLQSSLRGMHTVYFEELKAQTGIEFPPEVAMAMAGVMAPAGAVQAAERAVWKYLSEKVGEPAPAPVPVPMGHYRAHPHQAHQAHQAHQELPAPAVFSAPAAAVSSAELPAAPAVFSAAPAVSSTVFSATATATATAELPAAPAVVSTVVSATATAELPAPAVFSTAQAVFSTAVSSAVSSAAPAELPAPAVFSAEETTEETTTMTMGVRLGLVVKPLNCAALVSAKGASMGKTAGELDADQEAALSSLVVQCSRPQKYGEYCADHKPEASKNEYGAVTDALPSKDLEERLRGVAKKMKSAEAVKVLGERVGVDLGSGKAAPSLSRKRPAAEAEPETEKKAKKAKAKTAEKAEKEVIKPMPDAEEEEEEAAAAVLPEMDYEADSADSAVPAADSAAVATGLVATGLRGLKATDLPTFTDGVEEGEDEDFLLVCEETAELYGQVEVGGAKYFYNRELAKKGQETMLFAYKEVQGITKSMKRRVNVKEYKILN